MGDPFSCGILQTRPGKAHRLMNPSVLIWLLPSSTCVQVLQQSYSRAIAELCSHEQMECSADPGAGPSKRQAEALSPVQSP